MKKENYGIPATLLCLAAYVIGFGSITSGGSIWALVSLTIAVFALGFDSRVKKAFVQSISLAVIFFAVTACFELFKVLFGISYDPSGALSFIEIFSLSGADIVFMSFYRLIAIAKLVLFVILAITVLCKKDIILAPVHKAVDGFVPVKQYAQQPYGQPQQFNGQPQQFNGQPQQFNGQPQQFNGQPQQFNGQPQQFNNPNNGQ